MGEYRKVYVAKSRVEGAGLGLFANKVIKSGYTICPYKGDVLTEADLEARYSDELPVYAIPHPDDVNMSIDPRDNLEALGRYANASDFPGKRIRSNSVLEKNNGAVYLVAIRLIQKGDEILFNYGRDYWDRIDDYYSSSDLPESDGESLGSDDTDTEDSEL